LRRRREARLIKRVVVVVVPCALEVDAIKKEKRHAHMEKDVTKEEARVEEVDVDEADGKEDMRNTLT